MPLTVRFKQHEEVANLKVLTVSELRERYKEQWKIPTEAVAIVNGEAVDEDRVLRDGDRIEFDHSETMW